MEIDDQINNPIIKEMNSMRKIKRYNLFVENKTIEMRYCARWWENKLKKLKLQSLEKHYTNNR